MVRSAKLSHIKIIVCFKVVKDFFNVLNVSSFVFGKSDFSFFCVAGLVAGFGLEWIYQLEKEEYLTEMKVSIIVSTKNQRPGDFNSI